MVRAITSVSPGHRRPCSHVLNCRPRFRKAGMAPGLVCCASAVLVGLTAASAGLDLRAQAQEPRAGQGYVWPLPDWMPPPPVPADNPMSAAKVELGRRLFYDGRLAGLNYMSCSTCHRPELAFSDGRPVAIGLTGQRHP